MPLPPLLPERHPNLDFFIADIFDSIQVKDDMASMEHPIFSLSTKIDHRVLEYKSNGVSVSISPSYKHGLPTIFDKDVLLYCGSLIMDKINNDIIPPKTLRFICHDLLVTTNRPTNGDGYKRLKEALERLTSCFITTDIETNKIRQSKGFHILESYEIIDRSPLNNRMVKIEVTLSDWFYNSLIGKSVLTINRDFFRLRKPLERRLYEIARKHCGHQKEWKIKLQNLQLKTGSTSPEKKFRYYIRNIAKTNHLPDYGISISDNDIVTFSRFAAFDISEQEFLNAPKIRIKPQTMEYAKKITIEAETGWDFYSIHAQFCEFNANKEELPKNIDGAFVNFVRKKIAKCP